MRISKSFLCLALSALLTFHSARGQDQKANDPLNPLAFLTKHEWSAKLPDSPDGKKRSIHARFARTENGHAIRIDTQFVTDGKTTPYVNGLYAWDPQRHVIAFWYTDAEGTLSAGTVTLTDGKLIHEFQQAHPDGKMENFVARVTPLAGGEGWDNEILARKPEGLTTLVKVQYLPEQEK